MNSSFFSIGMAAGRLTSEQRGLRLACLEVEAGLEAALGLHPTPHTLVSDTPLV